MDTDDTADTSPFKEDVVSAVQDEVAKAYAEVRNLRSQLEQSDA